MRYLLIAVLAVVLGAFIGREIWGEKPPPPVDPVQVIITELKTHAVIQHERQLAVWYRACPSVWGKTPEIFIAWPARLAYQLELDDVQVSRQGSVITVKTSAIHPYDPVVPTDFVDSLSTTSIFTFANEQELVNREIGKATPIARYLTTYFLARDASLQADFAEELESLAQHVASALKVPVTRVEVDIPKVQVGLWPRLPKLELCSGTMASVNGLPFAKYDDGQTIPIGFHPWPSRRARATPPISASADAPKGIASVVGTAH